MNDQSLALLDAPELLSALQAAYPSASINWELILARQYGRCVVQPRTMIDIGANVGAHTAQMLALHPRKVVCFEPIPALADNLRTTFAGYPVEVEQVALRDRSGEAAFSINTDTMTESGLALRTDAADAPITTIRVETSTLDRYGFDEVSFIKMDCEGAEIDVLKGAVATVAKSRPLISVEYGKVGYLAYGHTQSALFDWACRNNYAVCDLFGHAMLSRAVFDACVDRYYWDFFLVPQERLSAITENLRNGAKEMFEGFSEYHS